MRFYCYSKCSTCTKARKYLEANNKEFTLRDLVSDQLNQEEITALYKKSGLPLKKFFNTSGLVYKEMNLKDKLKIMSEEEQLALLASNGKLIKRPILELDNKVLVGYKETEYQEV